MRKRGRKSAAELKTVADVAALPQRPLPPSDFGEEPAQRWHEIVDALPADYWRPSDLVQLADMIRTEQLVELCDQQIAIEGQVAITNAGPKVHPAVTARKGHLATIAAIQRSLRLCPSARTRPDAAKLQDRKAGKRPWQA